MSRNYTASKARSQGRPGWVVSFRHPLRKDLQGKPGLKMRRGLGTSDEVEADALVAQLNELLSDESWWNAARRNDADRKFAPAVVNAFFDEIQSGRPEPWAIREKRLPLPWRDTGYSRVLFVGTTGAGKTTLLRHMIGSDPENDRFPSTSTAKTTVSDIEIVLDDGGYSAVVTFSSEHVVLANIEECVADACVAVWEGRKDADVADRLLNHRDQRFRLGYTLGSFLDEQEADEDDFSFGDQTDATVEHDDEDAVSAGERERNAKRLRDYLQRIKALKQEASALVSAELGEDIDKLSGIDRDAAQELFEWRLSDSEGFSALAHDILEDVSSRFDLLEVGEITRLRSGWPEHWTLETEDRDVFIRAVRWFASNYAPQFGRLLTPLVDGIRVRGPLYPEFTSSRPKLVLLDGQGLGHTPESSSSVTTHITKRFVDVDTILLVDSAQQPMQAAPLSVVRAVASSGHQQKLAIAFSHFDIVKGNNLPTFAAKRAHVLGSVTNGLTNLRDALGSSSVIRAMQQTINDRCFMLGGLDRRSRDLPKGFQSELERLVGHFAEAIKPPAPPVAYPQYNTDGLPLAIQAAAQSFQRPWLGRLGLASHGSVSKEHWTRIKALNRRVAGQLDVEYDSLRPVADFVDRLTEEVSKYLSNPVGWDPAAPGEAEAEAALDLIRQDVHQQFHGLGMRRLIDEHLETWRAAFELRGKGSTFDRAQEIRDIYEGAAPIPSAVVTPVSATFMAEVRKIVFDAIKVRQGVLAAAAA